MHLKIGLHLKRLMRNREFKDSRQKLVLVDQLNLGSRWITEPTELQELAKFNLSAAKVSKRMSAFNQAAIFCRKGISLLPRVAAAATIWSHHYQLAFGLHSILAEMLFNIGECAESLSVADMVLGRIQAPSSSFPLLTVKVNALLATSQTAEAIDVCCGAIRKNGVRFSPRANGFQLRMALRKSKRLYDQRASNFVLSIDEKCPSDTVFCITMLRRIAVAAHYERDTTLASTANLRALQLTLQSVPCTQTAACLASYGVILAASGNFKDAYEAGMLAQNLNEHYSAVNQGDVGSHVVIHSSLRHLRRPLSESLDPMLKQYERGMEIGEILYAGQCLFVYVIAYFYVGLPLEPLTKDIASFSKVFERYKHVSIREMLEIYGCGIRFLTQENNDGKSVGDAWDVPRVANALNNGSLNSLRTNQIMLLVKMVVACTLADYSLATVFGERLWRDRELKENTLIQAMPFMFYSSFLCMVMEKAEPWKRLPYRRIRNRYMKKLETWRTKGSVNVVHLLQILYAERSALANEPKDKVLSNFGEAIRISSRIGALNYSAFAKERCAVYCLRKDDHENAVHYLTASIVAYKEWGATVKVKQMKEQYREYLHGSRRSSAVKSSTAFQGRERFVDGVTNTHFADVADLLRDSTHHHEVFDMSVLSMLDSSLIKFNRSTSGGSEQDIDEEEGLNSMGEEDDDETDDDDDETYDDESEEEEDSENETEDQQDEDKEETETEDDEKGG